MISARRTETDEKTQILAIASAQGQIKHFGPLCGFVEHELSRSRKGWCDPANSPTRVRSANRGSDVLFCNRDTHRVEVTRPPDLWIARCGKHCRLVSKHEAEIEGTVEILGSAMQGARDSCT
jgi:hypothetical protein